MKHEVKMVRAVRMVWVCSSFLALLSCVHGVGGPIDTVAAADSPNVIVIFVDDQGYYDLGCYSATEVETPRIDAMAREGVLFTDYYAAAPICSPSRAGLLTGCYPRRVGNHIWCIGLTQQRAFIQMS